MENRAWQEAVVPLQEHSSMAGNLPSPIGNTSTSILPWWIFSMLPSILSRALYDRTWKLVPFSFKNQTLICFNKNTPTKCQGSLYESYNNITPHLSRSMIWNFHFELMNRSSFEDLAGLGRIYYIFMDVPETLHDLEVIPGTTMGIVLQLTTTGLQFQKTSAFFGGRQFGALRM